MILRVNHELAVNEPGAYSTINEAISAAASGDTIVVSAGQYSESIVLDKRDITLKGEGEVVVAAHAPESLPLLSIADCSAQVCDISFVYVFPPSKQGGSSSQSVAGGSSSSSSMQSPSTALSADSSPLSTSTPSPSSCLVHISGGQEQPSIARCNLLCGLQLGADWCVGVSGGARPSIRESRLSGGLVGSAHLSGNSAASLYSTLITGSGGDGVVVIGRAAPRFLNATVSDHAGCGLMCLGLARVLLHGCSITNNKRCGLWVVAPALASVSENEVSRNAQSGCMLALRRPSASAGSSSAASSSSCSQFVKNEIHSNDEDGLACFWQDPAQYEEKEEKAAVVDPTTRLAMDDEDRGAPSMPTLPAGTASSGLLEGIDGLEALSQGGGEGSVLPPPLNGRDETAMGTPPEGCSLWLSENHFHDNLNCGVRMIEEEQAHLRRPNVSEAAADVSSSVAAAGGGGCGAARPEDGFVTMDQNKVYSNNFGGGVGGEGGEDGPVVGTAGIVVGGGWSCVMNQTLVASNAKSGVCVSVTHGSMVRLDNCRCQDNGRHGVEVIVQEQTPCGAAGGCVQLTGNVIESNARAGLCFNRPPAVLPASSSSSAAAPPLSLSGKDGGAVVQVSGNTLSKGRGPAVQVVQDDLSKASIAALKAAIVDEGGNTASSNALGVFAFRKHNPVKPVLLHKAGGGSGQETTRLVIVQGASGSGKTEVCKAIVAANSGLGNFMHVVADELAECNVPESTPLGVEMSHLTEAGKLVPFKTQLKVLEWLLLPVKKKKKDMAAASSSPSPSSFVLLECSPLFLSSVDRCEQLHRTAVLGSPYLSFVLDAPAEVRMKRKSKSGDDDSDDDDDIEVPVPVLSLYETLGIHSHLNITEHTSVADIVEQINAAIEDGV